MVELSPLPRVWRFIWSGTAPSERQARPGSVHRILPVAFTTPESCPCRGLLTVVSLAGSGQRHEFWIRRLQRFGFDQQLMSR